MKKIFNFVAFLLLINLCNGRNQFKNKEDRFSCEFPNPLKNGKIFVLGKNDQISPGTLVNSGTILSVSCDGQYQLNGKSILMCNDGSWSDPIGQCHILCPPLENTKTTKVSCKNNGKSIECQKATNGTVATFTCSPFYEDVRINANPFRVCQNGAWDLEKPDCTPKCGIKPKISKTSKGYFPWNIAMFKYMENDRTYFFHCVGTLINERVVLAPAHCVFNIEQKNSKYILVAGKNDDNFTSFTEKNIQVSEIEEKYAPDSYLDHVRKYTADIAVIIAKTPFNMTKNVQPVCIDWNNEFSKDFEYPQLKNAYIPGPLKSAFYPKSKNVVEIRVPLVNHTVCYQQLQKNDNNNLNFEAFYTFDKICSGYINSDQEPNCRVNQGSGLVTKNRRDGKYYLIGILSITPSLHRLKNCDNHLYALFTKVSVYTKDFILEKNNLFRPILRSEFQQFCGIKSVTATTLIVDGKNTTRGDYPWQVAIYRSKNNNNKQLICGGSIINARIVITAAHCVTDVRGNLFPKEWFVVAAGKYFRSFDNPLDSLAQFTTIKEMFIPSQYQGQSQNYVGDIALLITETSFKISRQVQPICVDWQAKYEKQFLTPTAVGFVAGWGHTQEDSNVSEVLRDLQVPYVNYTTCREQIPQDYEVYLTFDKMCAGFQNKGKSVCGGDSGGGLVFKNSNDNRYYLAGVVSLSPQAPTGGCDSQQFTLYTKISAYVKDFIFDKVKTYWA